MKTRIHIETTVVSYLTARNSSSPVVAGHQETTRTFWRQLAGFEAYISGLVLQEAGRGDRARVKDRLDALAGIPMLEADEEAKYLAVALVAGRAVPKEFPDDAMHIAIAAVNGIDCIVTWNFSHINNPFTRMMIRQISENAGYVAPDVCSPEEVLRGES